MKFSHFDHSINSYVSNFSYSLPSSQSYNAASFSSDGKLVVYLTAHWNSPDYTLYIHELDQGTGLYTLTIVGLNETAGSYRYIRDMVLEVRNGEYIMLVSLNTNYVNSLKRYSLTGTTATLVETLTYTRYPVYNYLYITRSA